MRHNYFSSALGSYKRNRFAVIINLTGLALSMAAIIAMAFFISREIAFDRNLEDHERVYRITEVINSGTYIENSSSLPYPMAKAMETDYPDFIEEIVQVFDFQVPLKSFRLENNDLYNEEYIYYADSNLFDVFDIPLKQGSAESVLDQPFNLIVSEELGQKWFGQETPVGKTVLLAGLEKYRCVITGVFTEGGPSHFKPRAILSLSTLESIAPGMKNNWVWNPVWTYVKLRPGVQIEQLTSRLPEFVRKHEIPALQNMITLHAQPISSIHLDSHLEFEMGANSDRKFIYIFISCAILLVVVAVVNFINMTTVTLGSRMKEIGARKVAGATNLQLIIQFTIEALILAIVAFLAGLGLLMMVRPWLISYFDLNISWAYLFSPGLLLTLLLIILITGLASGLYPAYVVSKIKIGQFFKGGIRNSRSGKIFRKSMVTLQFSLAVVIIIFSISAGKQFNYMLTKNKGFSDENIILLYISNTALGYDYETFKKQLLTHSGVKSVSILNEVIGVNNNNHEYRFGDLTGDEFRYVPALAIDEDFVKTVGMTLIAGRDYDKDIQLEDSLSIIVNRSATKMLGFENPEDAINQRFSSLSGEERIVGVVEDFHNKSLHHPVGPFVLDITKRSNFEFAQFGKFAVIKLNDMNEQTLNHIKTVWEQNVTNAPFDYTMLQDHINKEYLRESRMNKVLNAFALLSVIIACAGLFALTRILSGMKSKELAIRKVLGAETRQLMFVAMKEQLSMIIISVIVGSFCSFMLVQQWLSSFAFSVNQQWQTYVVASLASIVVAFLTIVFVAYRVSGHDPAPVLKTE
ncbi:MAG: ABC transporter permease [Flavobacteriales bacterium]|nr:ABC transporter permease [Flavobacteriales bacterium]